MITEKEKEYIATHWLPHKYLAPYTYGETFHKANPETYLAISRGAIFVQNTKNHLNVDSIIINNTFFEKDSAAIYKFMYKNVSDWCDFLYEHRLYSYMKFLLHSKKIFTITDYEFIIKNKLEITRECITHILSPTETYDRIYVL